MFQHFVPQRRALAKHGDACLQSLNLEGCNGRTESLMQVWATYQTLSEEGRKKKEQKEEEKEKQKRKENPGMIAYAYSPNTSLEEVGGSLATWRVLDHPGLYEALSNSSKGRKGPPPQVLLPPLSLRQPLRAFGPPFCLLWACHILVMCRGSLLPLPPVLAGKRMFSRFICLWLLLGVLLSHLD